MKKALVLPLLTLAVLAAVPTARADDTPYAASLVAPTLSLDAAPAADSFQWINPSGKGALPLPVHTVEGVGGGAITPVAYLVNSYGKNTALGLPTVAAVYLNTGSKDLESFSVSETLFGRLELSYAAERFGLGSFRDAVQKATTVDIATDELWMHNFNARFLAIEENSFGCQYVPAVTFGASLKYNADINAVNNRLGGALNSIGYNDDLGEDFTVTVTKMIPKVFDRPMIVTGGLRMSQGSHTGLLGFGKDWSCTFEGSVLYLPTDWLVIGYEFRQKDGPYGEIPGLIGNEENWNTFDIGWLINKHAVLIAGYGIMGTMANSEANNSFWLEFKYEF